MVHNISNNWQEMLLGDVKDWSIAETVHWLLTSGRTITDPALFLKSLGEHLIKAGANLARVRITLNTIDPEVRAKVYTWWRDKDEIEVFDPPHGVDQTPAYRGSPIEEVLEHRRIVRHKLTKEMDPDSHIILQELYSEGITDYVAFPLEFTDQSVSTFIIASDNVQGFSESDFKKFQTLLLYLLPVLEVFSTRNTIKSLLNTYVGPSTGRKILKGSVKRGDSELIECALWYSDLRNFTALTESLATDAMLQLLNSYFELITIAVTQRGGEVLRFIGDAMLIVFTAEELGSVDNACTAALQAAIEANNQLQQLNKELTLQEMPLLSFGVGLHMGKVVYGNVGSLSRLDFTVMGPAVNRTARLEDLTKKLDADLVLTAEFAEHITEPTVFLGSYEVKGVSEPLQVHTLKSFFKKQ
ncbi:adenylate/guanylate cyclase domain-containing protein [Spartinivicinus poritis]|uniref:Adenylate/guanylate cyclase domain-containing protein n=1 Tax=Spartinivicinus poritis TaxID=2994640 RepID=A0ABT5UAM3_9GAMM|nr:adenylate/guanylate cyclase domain-containing protein [Spartinivicinus sp. A2-2]MDE1462508.1 adenylate/guanylate cyclase domain-containing protein [Spartinivicinus sp. A2-2]